MVHWIWVVAAYIVGQLVVTVAITFLTRAKDEPAFKYLKK